MRRLCEPDGGLQVSIVALGLSAAVLKPTASSGSASGSVGSGMRTGIGTKNSWIPLTPRSAPFAKLETRRTLVEKLPCTALLALEM